LDQAYDRWEEGLIDDPLLIDISHLADVVTTASEREGSCEEEARARYDLPQAIQAVQEELAKFAPGDNAEVNAWVERMSAEMSNAESVAEYGIVMLMQASGQWADGTYAVPVLTTSLFNTAPATSQSITPLTGIITGSQSVNVRSGPGTGFGVAASVAPGTSVEITGRNADASWLAITVNGASGWIADFLVTVDGEVSTLPVSE
jgi:hypothetical protein